MNQGLSVKLVAFEDAEFSSSLMVFSAMFPVGTLMGELFLDPVWCDVRLFPTDRKERPSTKLINTLFLPSLFL